MSDVAEKIAELYAREQHDAKVTRASEVPTSYESMTDEWLTDVLCGKTPGARVVGHSFDERDDGSSNRRRIFLSYNDAGKQAGLPETVFCKASEKLENRLVLGISGAAQTEANFYNKVRDRLNIEATRAHYAGYDPENYASLIMLEDIGSRVTFCTDLTEVDWDRATSQMTTLANLHAPFYESAELGTDSLPFPTWHHWWNSMMKASPGFGPSCDKAFGQSEEFMSPALFRRRDEVWAKTMASADRHAELPRTLIHCDVHLKNWYVTPENVMGLSDWQIASIGHWSRDVVYTMVTALTIENRRKWEKELVRFYLDRMAEAGVPRISEDEAWLNLRQQLMTALAFWTITLCPAPGMPNMQPERTTHEFLRRIYAAIEDHDALDSF